tara:strand:+ start:268 stop:435 length:168 start_codon:yes stop_codon:yes gene_type:complete
MVKNNNDNCHKLAEEVVDDWDMGDLIAYAIERLTRDYLEDKEMFNNDWEDKFENQ